MLFASATGSAYGSGFEFDFSQWTDYYRDEDFARRERHRHNHRRHQSPAAFLTPVISRKKLTVKMPQLSASTPPSPLARKSVNEIISFNYSSNNCSPQKLLPTPAKNGNSNTTKNNIETYHHLFQKNAKMKHASSGVDLQHFFRFRTHSNPTLNRTPSISFSDVAKNNYKEEEIRGEILVDLEMLPLTNRLNVNLIRLRNISATEITCTADDWYFAKVQLVCSSPAHVTKKRTAKCRAEVKKDGDVLTTTGNWLEVDFSEHFNFPLRASVGGSSPKSSPSKMTAENNGAVMTENGMTKSSTTDSSSNYPDIAIQNVNNTKKGNNRKQKQKRVDCRLTISVYCQRGKHQEPSTVASSPDCGLMQSFMPSMKELIGHCTIGSSVTGMGGEHWAEAERAAEHQAKYDANNDQHTTIARWHSLILSKGTIANSNNAPTLPPTPAKNNDNHEQSLLLAKQKITERQKNGQS